MSFQQQLTKDIRTIKNTETILKFADKTSNVYKVPKEQYETLINNDITRSYKKVSKETPNQQPRKEHSEEQGSIKENVCE